MTQQIQKVAIKTSDPALTPAQAVIGTAVTHALDRDGIETTINSLLLALRYMRREVSARAGYVAQRQVDDLLRRSLGMIRVQRLNLLSQESNGLLPQVTAERAASLVILEDAVDTILLMHSITQADELVDGASGALVGQLVRLLDWVPQWEDIIDVLEEPENVIAAQAMAERPATRIH